MVRLLTLGSVALYDRDGTHLSGEATQSKRLALLAYLASGSGLHRRDKLVGLFWPESDHAHARASLNRSLHYLRQLLGEGAIQSVGRESLRLDLERVHVDTWHFRRAFETEAFDTALTLYRGDFLEGLFLSGLEEFEEWVEGERRELSANAEAAARRLTDAADRDGRASEAVVWARRALELAPFDGAAVARLVETTAKSGDRVGSLRVFAEFEERLAREFDISPPPELVALVERIRTPSRVDSSVVGTPPPPGSREKTSPAPASVRGSDDVRPGDESGSVPVVEVEVAPPRGKAPPSPRRTVGLRTTMVLLVCAAVLSVATVRVVSTLGSEPGLPGASVAVVPFENETGDPQFDDLAAALTAEIGRRISTSTSASVLSREILAGARAERGDGPRSGRAVLDETGATLVVAGDIDLRMDSVVIQVRITDGRAAQDLHRLEPVAVPGTGTLDALNRVAARATAAVASHLELGPEAALYTPPSGIATYREFGRGQDLLWAGRWRDAITHLMAAAEIDPAFVRPLLTAARAHSRFGRYDEAALVLSDLQRRRGTLRPVEALELDFLLAVVEGDVGRSAAAMRRLAATAQLTWSFEAGLWELKVNRPQAAVARLARLTREPALSESANRAEYWDGLSSALHRMGRDEEALEVALEGRQHHPESHLLLERELAALAGLGRVDDVHRRIWQSATHGEWRCVWRAALELRAHGHVEAAAVAGRSIVRLDTDPFIAARALLYFEGREEEATGQLLELAREDSVDLDYIGMSGVLAARRGDLAAIIEVDRRLEIWSDPHVRGQHTFWRAKIAAARGENISAVRLLAQAKAEGMVHSEGLHRDIDLEPLRGYHVFEEHMWPWDAELIRPPGPPRPRQP